MIKLRFRWELFTNRLQQIITDTWASITGTVRRAMTVLGLVIGLATLAVTTALRRQWNQVATFFSTLWASIVASVQKEWGGHSPLFRDGMAGDPGHLPTGDDGNPGHHGPAHDRPTHRPAAGVDAARRILHWPLAPYPGDFPAGDERDRVGRRLRHNDVVDGDSARGGPKPPPTTAMCGPTIRTTFSTAMTRLRIIVAIGMAAVRFGIGLVWLSITNRLTAAWTTIKALFNNSMLGLQLIVGLGMTVLQLGIQGVWQSIAAYLGQKWTEIKANFNTAMMVIRIAVSLGMAGIRLGIATVWTAISTFFVSTWTAIQTTFAQYLLAIQLWLGIQFLSIQTAIITTWKRHQAILRRHVD